MSINKAVASVMKFIYANVDMPKGVSIDELQSIVKVTLLSQFLIKHSVEAPTEIKGFTLNLTYPSALLKITAQHPNTALNFTLELPIDIALNAISIMEVQFSNLIETVTITKCNYPINLPVIRQLMLAFLSHGLQYSNSKMLNEKDVDYWIDFNLPRNIPNTLILNEVYLRKPNNTSDEVIFSVHNKFNKENNQSLLCGSFNFTLFNELRLTKY